MSATLSASTPQDSSKRIMRKHPLAGWRQRPCLLWSLGFLVLIVGLAVLAPVLAPDPTQIHPDLPTRPPGTAGHWFGTDDLGRDLLARMAIGAQISLLIGLSTAVVAVGFGTVYGITAALLGGKTDILMMRAIDVIYALPALMVVILFSVFLGRGVPALVLALALFSWPDTARIIRGQILSLKREEFVEAYHSLGGHGLGLILRHFIPNTLGFIILTATITIPRAILTESTLSFIGLGVEPPLSSWGTLASEGWQLVRIAPHMLIIPSVMIVSTMTALNLLGDELRTHWDPKQAKR